MNPIIIFILFMLVYKEDNRLPNYYDTFTLEQIAGKLNFAISALDRINHLNELAHIPLERGNITNTLEDSIHTVKPLLASGRTLHQLENVESVMSNVKKISDLHTAMETLAPMISPMLQLAGSRTGIQGSDILSALTQVYSLDSNANPENAEADVDTDADAEPDLTPDITFEAPAYGDAEQFSGAEADADADIDMDAETAKDYAEFLRKWREADESDEKEAS